MSKVGTIFFSSGKIFLERNVNFFMIIIETETNGLKNITPFIAFELLK